MSSDAAERESRRDTRLRFEQWARNPACQANTISAVHGIKMAEVAAKEGLKPTMGQSPFALARGQSFERGLFREKGKSLRDALEEAGVLPKDSEGFADFRLRPNGGPMPGIDRAKDQTLELLAKVASGKSAKPSIIAAGTLSLPARVMLPEAILIVDVIAVDYREKLPVVTVGEIKTYPDRGGHTDPTELAGARAQAGVYVHALKTVVQAAGLASGLTIAEDGFLVLSKPGSNRPAIRAREQLRFQAWRAERGFSQLEEAARTLPPPGSADPLQSVLNADTSYCEACISFCDRAPGCHDRALNDGSPIALGEDVARLLGSVGLNRAAQLLDGTRPQGRPEEDLVRRLGGGA